MLNKNQTTNKVIPRHARVDEHDDVSAGKTGARPAQHSGAQTYAQQAQLTDTQSPPQPEIRNKRGKKVHTKLVYKRNLFWNILFSLCTNIYQLFWSFEIDKETKAITKNNKGVSSCRVVVFSIITLGIFAFVWIYKNASKQEDYARLHNLKCNNNFAVKYTLITVIGETLMIIAYFVCCLALAVLVPEETFAIIAYAGILTLTIPYIVVLALMQNKNNKFLLNESKNGRKEIIVRNSDILNRTVWGTIFLFLAAELLISFATEISSAIVDIVLPGATSDPTAINSVNDVVKQEAQRTINSDALEQVIPNICTILAGFLILIGFCLWFRHYKIEGILTRRKIGKAFLYCLPGFSICILNVLGFVAEGGINVRFGLLLLGFVPGVTEEVTFRGILIPNFMRIKNRKAGIYLALFVSSGIFGLIHITNYFAGADLGSSIFQATYAFALGLTFAAVIIRTGNIWPAIVCHGLIDTLAYMSPTASQQGSIQTQAFEFSPDVIVLIIISVLLIAYGIFLCRPKKHAEINELWANKLKGSVLKTLKRKKMGQNVRTRKQQV